MGSEVSDMEIRLQRKPAHFDLITQKCQYIRIINRNYSSQWHMIQGEKKYGFYGIASFASLVGLRKNRHWSHCRTFCSAERSGSWRSRTLHCRAHWGAHRGKGALGEWAYSPCRCWPSSSARRSGPCRSPQHAADSRVGGLLEAHLQDGRISPLPLFGPGHGGWELELGRVVNGFSDRQGRNQRVVLRHIGLSSTKSLLIIYIFIYDQMDQVSRNLYVLLYYH